MIRTDVRPSPALSIMSILAVCTEKGSLDSEDLGGLSLKPESVLLSVSVWERSQTWGSAGNGRLTAQT